MRPAQRGVYLSSSSFLSSPVLFSGSHRPISAVIQPGPITLHKRHTLERSTTSMERQPPPSVYDLALTMSTLRTHKPPGRSSHAYG